MALAEILFMSDTDTLEQLTEMKVGSIVRSIDPNDMDKGALNTPAVDLSETNIRFGHAIVVSMTPFVLVSDGANMRWETTVDQSKFKAIGMATKEALDLAMLRLNA